jgi:hypothetical protein
VGAIWGYLLLNTITATCLSNAALLCSTKSADTVSSFDILIFVIPIINTHTLILPTEERKSFCLKLHQPPINVTHPRLVENVNVTKEK